MASRWRWKRPRRRRSRRGGNRRAVTMSLLDVAEAAEKQAQLHRGRLRRAWNRAALCRSMPSCAHCLEDASVSKQTHDVKAATARVARHGRRLCAVPLTTPCCCPTRSIPPTPRSRWPMLPRRNGHAPPASLAAAPRRCQALVPALRAEAEECQVTARLFRDRSAACAGALSHGAGGRAHR